MRKPFATENKRKKPVRAPAHVHSAHELELEPQMAQKLMLRGEVGARALRVR